MPRGARPLRNKLLERLIGVLRQQGPHQPLHAQQLSGTCGVHVAPLERVSRGVVQRVGPKT